MGFNNERANPGTNPEFTITNLTANATMDCSTAADQTIADVLGTLIRNLQEKGIIGGTTATH